MFTTTKFELAGESHHEFHPSEEKKIKRESSAENCKFTAFFAPETVDTDAVEYPARRFFDAYISTHATR